MQVLNYDKKKELKTKLEEILKNTKTKPLR